MYVSTNARPDITCAVNLLSQVTGAKATEEDFKVLDKVFKKLKSFEMKLKYGHVFADSSFANNKELSSQLGSIILLVDKYENCSVIAWSSTKCKRITRSALAAGLYAPAHAYDYGFTLAYTINALLKRKVKTKLLTDSRTLFDSIIPLCSMTEKRPLMDIFGLREAYRNGDLPNLGWIRTHYNVSNALTKDQEQGALHDVLRDHKINTPVYQWIDKGKIPPRS